MESVEYLSDTYLHVGGTLKIVTVISLISGYPRELKKCLLVELLAYENYSHQRTPKKNRVDFRLRESYLAGVNYFLLGSQK